MKTTRIESASARRSRLEQTSGPARADNRAHGHRRQLGLRLSWNGHSTESVPQIPFAERTSRRQRVDHASANGTIGIFAGLHRRYSVELAPPHLR